MTKRNHEGSLGGESGEEGGPFFVAREKPAVAKGAFRLSQLGLY